MTMKEENKSNLQKALDYVREQMDDYKLAVVRAQRNHNWVHRMLVQTDYDEEIQDLLEEWGEEHDLPEGWWANEADMEDILMEV